MPISALPLPKVSTQGDMAGERGLSPSPARPTSRRRRRGPIWLAWTGWRALEPNGGSADVAAIRREHLEAF